MVKNKNDKGTKIEDTSNFSLEIHFLSFKINLSIEEIYSNHTRTYLFCKIIAYKRHRRGWSQFTHTYLSLSIPLASEDRKRRRKKRKEKGGLGMWWVFKFWIQMVGEESEDRMIFPASEVTQVSHLFILMKGGVVVAPKRSVVTQQSVSETAGTVHYFYGVILMWVCK